MLNIRPTNNCNDQFYQYRNLFIALYFLLFITRSTYFKQFSIVVLNRGVISKMYIRCIVEIPHMTAAYKMYNVIKHRTLIFW